jgi:hypothetical protein
MAGLDIDAMMRAINAVPMIVAQQESVLTSVPQLQLQPQPQPEDDDDEEDDEDQQEVYDPEYPASAAASTPEQAAAQAFDQKVRALTDVKDISIIPDPIIREVIRRFQISETYRRRDKAAAINAIEMNKQADMLINRLQTQLSQSSQIDAAWTRQLEQSSARIKQLEEQLAQANLRASQEIQRLMTEGQRCYDELKKTRGELEIKRGEAKAYVEKANKALSENQSVIAELTRRVGLRTGGRGQPYTSASRSRFSEGPRSGTDEPIAPSRSSRSSSMALPLSAAGAGASVDLSELLYKPQ